MKIIEASAGVLTNFEVLDFLRNKGESSTKDENVNEIKSSGDVDGEVNESDALKLHLTPSEMKVYDYLKNTAARDQTREYVSEFLQRCKKYGLAQADILPVINLRPSEPTAAVELFSATIQGFEARGYSKNESENLLKQSVDIAQEARDIYNKIFTIGTSSVVGNGGSSQRPVLVAATVGSFGAYLADGSEYSGNYGSKISKETLKNFHRRRVQILANSGADIIAFETISNKLEAEAYAELLKRENVQIPSWFAFSSVDGVNVVSGDAMESFAAVAESCRHVVAVGINCTPPRFIQGLISSIHKVTDKPIVVYPNSGETYNGALKIWEKSTCASNEADFVSHVGEWLEAGATLIGGCCRTTPNTIRAISTVLYNKSLQ